MALSFLPFVLFLLIKRLRGVRAGLLSAAVVSATVLTRNLLRHQSVNV